jgi:putative restriction endonuclease
MASKARSFTSLVPRHLMRGFIGNTDYKWFTQLRAIEPPIDEVNFWRPGTLAFKMLRPGDPVLFHLKAPRNAIAGFGTFVHFSILPSLLAWEVYGPANGAASYAELRARLIRLRSRNDIVTPGSEFQIGCILLTQPVFFEEHEWVRTPSDWRPNVPPGLAYDLTEGEGKRVWLECLERAAKRPAFASLYPEAPPPPPPTFTDVLGDTPITGGYGPAALLRPRLGQRSFRVAVLDSYGRRCTITNERTLPVLEAAHIRDYRDVQEHTLGNGILFRSDIHKLFDSGYVTVTPDYHFEVSRRIKEEFENGRDYYALHGSPIRLPAKPSDRPDPASLIWHNEERYRG